MELLLNWVLPAVALVGTVWVVVFVVREDTKLYQMLDVDKALGKDLATSDTESLLAEVERMPSYIWWETEASIKRRPMRRKFFARRKVSKLTMIKRKRRKL